MFCEYSPRSITLKQWFAKSCKDSLQKLAINLKVGIAFSECNCYFSWKVFCYNFNGKFKVKIVTSLTNSSPPPICKLKQLTFCHYIRTFLSLTFFIFNFAIFLILQINKNLTSSHSANQQVHPSDGETWKIGPKVLKIFDRLEFFFLLQFFHIHCWKCIPWMLRLAYSWTKWKKIFEVEKKILQLQWLFRRSCDICTKVNSLNDNWP